MSKFFESFKERPVLWSSIAVGTAALTTVAAIEMYGFSQHPTSKAPAGSCESPMAETTVYQDSSSTWLDLYTGTGEGVVLSGELSEGAIGVRAAFKYGGPGNHEWIKSDVVPPTPGTDEFAVKLAVGDGPVVFGVQIVADGANRDQPVCTEVPDIKKEYFKEDFSSAPGNLPYPQPGNVLFNTLS